MRGLRNIPLLALAVLLALAALAAGPVAVLGQSARARDVWVAVDEAPVRAAPSAESELLLRLPRGTQLRALCVQDDWAFVQKPPAPRSADADWHGGWLYLPHLSEAAPPPVLGSVFDPLPRSMILADVADTARSERSHGSRKTQGADELLAALDLPLTSAALDDFLRRGGLGEYARERGQGAPVRAQLPPLAPAVRFSTAADAEAARQLGFNLAARVLRENARPAFGMALARYVNLVGLAVARHAPEGLPSFKVLVLDLSEPVSFSLPGGLVLLSTGLLAALENEAQLALVLAHEASHAALGHLWAKALEAPFFRLGGVVDAESARGPLFAAMLNDMQNLALVRGLEHAHEFDADAAAIGMAWLAGYDVRQWPRAIERIEAAGLARRRLVPPKDWAALHPPTPQRLERIKALLERLPAQEAPALGTERFLSIR